MSWKEEAENYMANNPSAPRMTSPSMVEDYMSTDMVLYCHPRANNLDKQDEQLELIVERSAKRNRDKLRVCNQEN